MLEIAVEDIRPVVRIANHHPVRPGESWARTIPDLQLICILSGDFVYAEGDSKEYFLAPGEVLFIEPVVQHRFSYTGQTNPGQIAGVHFECIPQGSWGAGDYRLALKPERVTQVENVPRMQERFIQLAAAFESYRPYRQALVNTLTAEILLVLAAHWQTETALAERPSERMTAVLGYIRANLAGPLNRRILARAFNLSAGYVNELFQAELGMTPSEVINRERLARAYQLMERDNLNVTEAALAVGFRDPFYFSRRFKSVYGFPPSQIVGRRGGRG